MTIRYHLAMGTKLFCILALLLVGCAGSDPSADGSVAPEKVCTPGKTEACACPGGTMGAQSCNMAGSAYGECACEAPMPDGGQLGTTGGSGSTSVGAGSGTTGSRVPAHCDGTCKGITVGGCGGTCDGYCGSAKTPTGGMANCSDVCNGTCTRPFATSTCDGTCS